MGECENDNISAEVNAEETQSERNYAFQRNIP